MCSWITKLEKLKKNREFFFVFFNFKFIFYQINGSWSNEQAIIGIIKVLINQNN